MNRRAFISKLFGGAAGVAVTLYPANSLGLLERLFYRKKKSIFIPCEEDNFLKADGFGEIRWEVWSRDCDNTFVAPAEFIWSEDRKLGTNYRPAAISALMLIDHPDFKITGIVNG